MSEEQRPLLSATSSCSNLPESVVKEPLPSPPLNAHTDSSLPTEDTKRHVPGSKEAKESGNRENNPRPAKPKTSKKQLSSLERKQKIANVVVHSRLKPNTLDYEPVQSDPVPTSQVEVNGTIFRQYEDLPINRRGYKYKVCKPNPLFPSNKFATSDLPPYTVRASYFDKSYGIACSEDLTAVTTAGGWISSRCNVAMKEGNHYFEYEILNGNNDTSKDNGIEAHVRIGIGRKELALDAPVGFDGYGYGLRDLNGQKITLSRPQDFMKEGFKTGDVIGFVVELPSLEAQRASNQKFVESYGLRSRPTSGRRAEDNKKLNAYGNIVRDQIPIKYKSGLYFEQFEYTKTKQMDHLLNPVTVFGEKAVLEENRDVDEVRIPTIPGSRILVYKNGVLAGEMFRDLYSFLPLETLNNNVNPNTEQSQNPAYMNTDDGSLGYYPMMSVFMNGIVKINAGPHFKYPLPENCAPLYDNYTDKIAEDWLYDIIDEVEAEYLDSFD